MLIGSGSGGRFSCSNGIQSVIVNFFTPARLRGCKQKTINVFSKETESKRIPPVLKDLKDLWLARLHKCLTPYIKVRLDEAGNPV